MTKTRVRVNWNKTQLKYSIDPVLKSYETYLRQQGYRETSIIRYSSSIKIYLNITGSIKPSTEDAIRFRESLLGSNLKRSTINNYSAAIKQFHKMHREDVELPFLKLNNKLPYYLSSCDVLNILSVIPNLKHYSMVLLAFYCMLRASELIHLDDSDLDLKNLTLRIREGKGGKDAILPIAPDCAEILRQYLNIRPKIVLEDGSIPLFPTDYCNRWDRRDLYRMFVAYKRKAGINIPGGTHLLRHSAATILLRNGVDLLTLKELLRHSCLTSTEKYCHLQKETIREKYEKFLKL